MVVADEKEREKKTHAVQATLQVLRALRDQLFINFRTKSAYGVVFESQNIIECGATRQGPMSRWDTDVLSTRHDCSECELFVRAELAKNF